MSVGPPPTLAGPDGWRFDPDGAALHDATGTAVVADVHLGYEWARARGGDSIPAHSLAETLDKLARIYQRMQGRMTRLIVAGDLVESARPCRRATRDVGALRAWLAGKGVELVVLQGNHDPPTRPPRRRSLEVGGWTIAHGHEPIDAPRAIIGHHHPALRSAGLTAPCFLIHTSKIILPAFSPNAAGVALERLPLRRADLGAFRCLATAGGEILDFGPVARLLTVLRA